VIEVETIDVSAGSVVRTVEVDVLVTVAVPVVMVIVEVVQRIAVLVVKAVGIDVEVSLTDFVVDIVLRTT